LARYWEVNWKKGRGDEGGENKTTFFGGDSSLRRMCGGDRQSSSGGEVMRANGSAVRHKSMWRKKGVGEFERLHGGPWKRDSSLCQGWGGENARGDPGDLGGEYSRAGKRRGPQNTDG